MPLKKISAANGNVPADAIRAGTDVNGAPLYICTAYAHGGVHPGKLRSDFGACDVSYGGIEEFYANYEVLVPSWVTVDYATLLDFPAGYDVDGTALHICRAYGSGDFGTCNCALNGQERSTTFELSGRQVGETLIRRGELQRSQNQLQFAFVGFNDEPEESLRYKYRLEGGDADWQGLGRDHEANYPGLSPGRYRFLVKAVNSEGRESTTPAEVDFAILPPVWSFVTYPRQRSPRLGMTRW